MKHLLIQSRWGALSGLILLQLYGIALLHAFGTMLTDVFTHGLSGFLGNIGPATVFLVFFSLFVFIESSVLTALYGYLRRSTFHDWAREFRSPQKVAKGLAALPLLYVYAILVCRPAEIGIPPLSWALILVYQAAHPIAATGVGALHKATSTPSTFRVVPVREQLAGVFGATVGGVCFLVTGMAVGTPIWLLPFIGVSLIMTGMLTLLLEDIRTQAREVPT